MDKISWSMLHELPALEQKLELYKTTESKARLPVMCQMTQCDSFPVPHRRNFVWRLSIKSSSDKPRWIIVLFQSDKSGSQTNKPTIFDHCNLTNMFVMLNSRRYPETDFGTNFAQHKLSRMYGNAAVFRTKFYHLEELISYPNITPADYKEL